MMLLYIDPSAVSYIIPAIAGVAVVIGSWVYLHFRRTKSKVQKKLGIDENDGKEVEEDIVINDDEQADKTKETTAEEKKD